MGMTAAGSDRSSPAIPRNFDERELRSSNMIDGILFAE